ncbi:NAD(P)H-hydrate dehydratase [Odoribacter sp. OttesenSCG-928-J03]|nr:NAD(P)H-hydrate dehydratase [Odoribacter sp. OttesenSCG-928-J03]MDL2330417.1 NAD(P)H-hydrate dehydratase [Odoribacter sp. OttesenSCG-928-A06]
MREFSKVFRTEDIPNIDRYTIENESISSVELMERAASLWTDFFLTKSDNASKIVVVAGNGNNGGDGYVIARLLLDKGRDVTVVRPDISGKMSEDCRKNYERYRAGGGNIQEIESVHELEFTSGILIIDAIFGTGLNRQVEGIVAEVIRKINESGNKVYSVDIPSGLMGEDNSNNNSNAIVKADYTFTFQFPKLSFFLAENEEYVGSWFVLDIHLNRKIMAEIETPYFILDKNTVRNLLPASRKFAHKGSNGHGLLIAGSSGMMGASVLAARAAVHSGVGLLTCHVPEMGGDVMQIAVPEALLSKDDSPHFFSAINHLEKYSAVAVGPGLGKNPQTVRALRHLLKEWRGVTILDADALNILAENRDLFDLLHENCILTPHPKEFERLAGKSTNDFERLNKLSTFAGRYRVSILLKGAHTVIASPSGGYYFNTTGNPGMAKGGMGDVLTGVLLALASNGMNVLDVILIGVYAHGLAADILAEEKGQRGISAGDVAEGMGKAWKELEMIG